jgi:hypothetical protein
VDKDGGSAKVWLSSVTVATNVGLSPTQLGEVVRRVRVHRERPMEAWNGFFGTEG